MAPTTSGWIEVDQFDALATQRVTGRGTRTPLSLNRSRLVGLGGTLVLHGFTASLFIPSTPIPKAILPASAGFSQPQNVAADELVLVSIGGPNEEDSIPGAPQVDLRPRLTKLAIPLVTPDRPSVVDLPGTNGDGENSAHADSDSEYAEFRARMFGRYTGQIRARIERAWERPTSPVNESTAGRSTDTIEPTTFACQVEIRQDEKGDVQEVLLLACNGTEAWQHSLVVAINQSSPLPAPPMATVFKRAITMIFQWPVDRRDAPPAVAGMNPRSDNQ